VNTINPLIYALIFAALALLNYLMQRLAKRLKEQPPPEQKAPQARERTVAEVTRRARDDKPASPAQEPRERRKPRESARQREPAEPRELREWRDRLRRAQAPTSPTAPPRCHVGARAFLSGRQNLRRAIVIRTVLGPCRAQEPHDADR